MRRLPNQSNLKQRPSSDPNRNRLTPKPAFEICILAGGLSSRMGQDKSRLRLGRQTLLGHIQAAAYQLACPVRVVRQDLLPRCGPLGGIWTGLTLSKRDAVLFLSCDMPFVTPAFLKKIVKSLPPKRSALFVRHQRQTGFPFLIRKSALELVRQQIQSGSLSLQALARRLQAAPVMPRKHEQSLLFNINTPEDWAKVLAHQKSKRKICATKLPPPPHTRQPSAESLKN